MENLTSKSILIGLGGTGSRTINNVLKIRKEKHQIVSDGPVSCVVFDTNDNDQDLLRASNTGAVLFQTSETQTVGECMGKIIENDPKGWCPYPEDFLGQIMTDGASEMRVKSRLAFEGALDNNAKRAELESQLTEILNYSDKEVIRIVIVSSLSGGTGSGMFIQTALWLRKLFGKLNNIVTIRGVFLLPDIFVSNADSIKNNDNTIESHYANAYAAIRELNTLNRIIQKGYRPARRIVIGDLFDSDNPPERPVYDQCFFVDSANTNGGSLNNIQSYEKYVANLVYMQLYSPLAKELYSVEDNNYKISSKSDVPLYGACGSSRAIYPAEQIMEYCALRATKDALSTGWRKLDLEIQEMIEERKEKEREGIFLNKIDPQAMYIKLFDEKSNVPYENAGSDRLFLNIKNDIFVKSTAIDEETGEQVSDGDSQCKVLAFIDSIRALIAEKVIGNESLISWHVTSGPRGDKPWLGTEFGDVIQQNRKYELAKDAFVKLHNDKKDEVDGKLKKFDGTIVTIANEFDRTIFSMDMGAVNMRNPASVYGMFAKENADGEISFIHPIAARYLLYKLVAEIKSYNASIDLTYLKNKVHKIEEDIEWDTKLTKRKQEDTIDDLVDNSFITSDNKKKHLEDIASKCYEYHKAQYNAIVNYETAAIEKELWKLMLPRILRLVELIEIFFNDLPDVSEDIDAMIGVNDKMYSKNDLAREIPILTGKKHKEMMYESLGIDVSDVAEDVNKEIINTIYGKLCAERRSRLDENKKYADVSVSTGFLDSVKNHFSTVLDRDYSDKVRLTIYDAICKQSDFDYTGNVEDAAMKDFRHKNAAKQIKKELEYKAAPSLIYKSETHGIVRDEEKQKKLVVETSSGNKKVNVLQRSLKFWGHSKNLNAELANLLGANVDISGQEGYSDSELCCFSAVYGINAVDIAKFDETNRESEFYRAYEFVIEEMLERKAAADSEETREMALLQTPHIDKNWHEYLPFVSEEKQRIEDEKFYRTFWLSLAYGHLSLNNDGFQLKREEKAEYYTEEPNYQEEALTYDGRPITRSEIGKLLHVLRTDARFMASTAAEMEKKLEEDLAKTKNKYVETDIYKGLIASQPRTVDMITTYSKERKHSTATVVTLIAVLGDLMGEVVENFDIDRSEEGDEKKQYELCADLYNSAELKKNYTTQRKKIFTTWLSKFKALHIPCADADITEEEAEDTEE